MGDNDDAYDALEASLDEIDSAPEAPVGDSEREVERRDLADRLTGRFFWLCENPRTSRRTLRLVEASVSDADSARKFYALLNRRMAGMIGRRMNVSAARMELVGGQLVGTAMLRYVLGVEPVASMPLERLLPMVSAGVRGVLSSEPGGCDGPSTPGEQARLAGPGSSDVVEAWMQVGRAGRGPWPSGG